MKIKTGLAVGASVVCLLAVGTGGAVAQSLVTSKDIKDGTVRVKDMREGAVKQFSKPGPAGEDGAQGVAGKDGAQGVAGKDGKDGAPGLSNLIVGSGYAGLGAHDYWAADSYGETIEECPEGQNAIGGGFSQDGSTGGDGKYDLGGEADVQITVSAPYFRGEYVPVDDAGNFRADQWVVRGYNHSDQPVDVRAWVVCADVK